MNSISSPKSSLLRAGVVSTLLGTALLALAGCYHPDATVAERKGPRDPADAIAAAPTTAESHAFTGTTGDQIGDDYVYYPNYEVYYSPVRKEYVYYNGTVWVRSSRPAQGWEDIGNSPSVPMTFHDSPETHHMEITRQYPRTWTPAVSGHPTRTTNDDLVEGKSRK